MRFVPHMQDLGNNEKCIRQCVVNTSLLWFHKSLGIDSETVPSNVTPAVYT